MEQVIATMLILGLVVGFCGGYFYGSWATERQHAKERKERQEIANLIKSGLTVKVGEKELTGVIQSTERRKGR
jgi:flagellar basal body-associated protein FliL